jgi:hypothetical protein
VVNLVKFLGFGITTLGLLVYNQVIRIRSPQKEEETPLSDQSQII